jgi:NitT/TauT family transport system permease protein
MRRLHAWLLRAMILAAFLLLWQYLPQWGWARARVHWLDPFFISSPSLVYHELVGLFGGKAGLGGVGLSIWPYLWNTVKATLIGTALGLAIGGISGAVLSNSPWATYVLEPFVTMVNSIPRIALIPIVVLIVGPTLTASVVSAVLVVTFLAFYNALEGGRSVPAHVVQNASLLGASRLQVMLRVRAPYVLTWVFAAVPNAIAFGLLMVVTGELITGSKGMGDLILSATANADATLSISVVVVLSCVGLILVTCADRVKRTVLHWAD